MRWVLSMRLNPGGDILSYGTLSANAIGAYIIGLALAYADAHPHLSPSVKLFIITGFCGGLTTFSTFSAEVVALLQANRPIAAGINVMAHVAVSLALTWLGLRTLAQATAPT